MKEGLYRQRDVINVTEATGCDSIRFTCPVCKEIQDYHFNLTACPGSNVIYLYCKDSVCKTRLEIVVGNYLKDNNHKERR